MERESKIKNYVYDAGLKDWLRTIVGTLLIAVFGFVWEFFFILLILLQF